MAAAAPPAEAAPPALEFATDAQGRHAVYRLRKGEALYSAVVVRFTGRVHAEDVNAKAAEIAARSGVPDVHAIPVGLPDQDSGRRPRARVPASRRSGAHRGAERPAGSLAVRQHGARPRTSRASRSSSTPATAAATQARSCRGCEEAAYVYDIACRVERIVSSRTRARVVPTVGRSSPCPAARADAVGESRSARVLTTPPYPIEDAAVGVNFRWYLANSVYRNVGKNGGHEDRTVFISLHADSLHPAVRGTMIYVPGEKFLSGSFAKSGEPYVSRREVREAPRVSFSRREKIEAEGVSRDLAERLVGVVPAGRPAAPPLPAHPAQRHPGRARVGARDSSLQPHPGARADRGLQSQQPRRPKAPPHPGLSREGGGRHRRRARRLLRRIAVGAGCPDRSGQRRRAEPPPPTALRVVYSSAGRTHAPAPTPTRCLDLRRPRFRFRRVGAFGRPGLEGPRPRRRGRQERQGRARGRRHGQAPLGEEQPRRTRCDDGREREVGVLRHRGRPLEHRLRSGGLQAETDLRFPSWKAAATKRSRFSSSRPLRLRRRRRARSRRPSSRWAARRSLRRRPARSRPATRRSRAKNCAAARENYVKAAAELPDNGPLLQRVAVAYLGEGNKDEALRYARLASEKSPQDSGPWQMIAEIEIEKGNAAAGLDGPVEDPAREDRRQQPLHERRNPPLQQEAASRGRGGVRQGASPSSRTPRRTTTGD